MNLKYELQRGMVNLNYVTDHILYQILKVILSKFKKKHGEEANNPLIKIYVNKIENRITFKMKTVYYLKLLSLEIMTLLRRTKSKVTKNKNGENVPHLEINELLLVHCNIVNNDYQHVSRALYTFISNKSFGQLLDISPKNLYF